ncbi:tetratricopeptide repeat protein [Azospirillum sp. sgz302134]
MTIATLSEALSVALDHHMAGRLPQAEIIYSRVLEADPEQPDALHLLGVVLTQTGRTEDGIGLIRRAVGRCPDSAGIRTNLGRVLRAAGHPAEAAAVLRLAAALAPDAAELWGELGTALGALGRYDAAIPPLAHAVAIDPANAEAAGRLTILLHRRGRALLSAGRDMEAGDELTRAAVLAPADADLRTDLAVARYRTGRLGDAEASLRAALALCPDDADALSNLSNVLERLGRLSAAALVADWAVVAAPEHASAHLNRANTLAATARTAEAAASLRRALVLEPQHDGAWSNLGGLLRAAGRPAEAIALYRRAMALAPAKPHPHRELLAATLYDPSWTEEERYAEHRRFEERHARPLYARRLPPAPPGDPGKRLRVGYLSSDFRDHPVARNLVATLDERDRARFEIVLYADVARPDAMTARMRSLADQWHGVFGLSDEAVARRIHADAIDVMIYLAGHFDENRPLVAAYRPAPVQVSFHDPATSGLRAIDYLIGDPVLTPRRGGGRFVERPVRLPSFYLHEPIAGAPDPAPPPSACGAAPVFGCFNNPAKIGEAVLALWARVLAAVPGARLLLKYKDDYADAALRRRVLGTLAAHGVDPARVELAVGRGPIGGHLALYDRVDVALDPFPFCGSTTTFEALWMGVPAVTLPGEPMVSRWSASMLRSVGLADLVAGSPEAYVGLAAALAADTARLSALRMGLRARVAASPLCDARAKTRQLERIIRALWVRHCRTR